MWREHDWLSANGLSVIKSMDDKSVMLLTNDFDPKATQQIDRREALFMNTASLWVE